MRGTRALQLTHALLACDRNSRYLAVWPLVRRAWTEIVGVDPVLVLVSAEADVPAMLRDDACVHVFEPVPSVHETFQAQCIRLLYPALMPGPGAVVVSDIDLVPLSARYFRRPLARVGERDFVAYRDALLPLGEVPICFNAALPRTWSSVFGVETPDDVRARLAEWGTAVHYDGTHDGRGWTADQRILHRTLLERGRASRDVWILDDAYTGFRRLDRTYVEKWGELSPAAREGLARGRFTDYHCVLPHEGRSRELNELVLELALAARRRP